MFKRRTRRPLGQRLLHIVYPAGGWRRSISYIWHRLRRIPDKPHRIARGVFVGIFVSFTPFFGFHLLIAAAAAWLVGGNLVASLLATLIGNPLTFPLIMSISVSLGNWILGTPQGISLPHIIASFAAASVELWKNATAIFTGHPMHWELLDRFYHHVFVPYTIGGLVPGLILGIAGYYLTLPAISAYQKHRRKKWAERLREGRAHHHRAPPALAPEPPQGEKSAGSA